MRGCSSVLKWLLVACATLKAATAQIATTPDGYNCEPLNDVYQVRWQVQENEVAIELVGLIEDGVYMSFGVSGLQDQTRMIGGDVAVGDWWNGNARVRDFYMNVQAPCAAGTGVCPEGDGGSFTNDISQVSGSQAGGLTVLKYARPLNPSNVGENAGIASVDSSISTDAPTRIIWAMGNIQSSTSNPLFHSVGFGGTTFEFGRTVQDNCSPLIEEAQEMDLLLGTFETRQHKVAGEVWARSERVLEVRNFVFDGNAPAAYFWADATQSDRPTPNGYRLQDGAPAGSCGQDKLPGADGSETFRVEFPEGTSLRDIVGGTVSVWCEAFDANFGELVIPDTLEGLRATANGPALECSEGGGGGDAAPGPAPAPAPEEQEEILIGSLQERDHDVAGEVWALSERVLEIRNFEFDGNAPAAFFWADATQSDRPTPNGFILQDGAPTNSCGEQDIPGADGSETYRVEFPEGTSLLDVLGGTISVWCEEFSANFGEVQVPETIEGLRSTANGPALQCSENQVPPIAITPDGYNCEPLNDEFQVRWQVQGESIAIELLGLIDDGNYMSFGVSGSDEMTDMVGADTVVADFFEGSFRARDFFMNSRGQCSNGLGVCPDTDGSFTDDVSAVSGEQDSGVTLVRYMLPLTPSNIDDVVGDPAQAVDRRILVEEGVSTFLVWALGPIDPGTGLPFFHTIDFPRQADSPSLEFGRAVQDNCPLLVGGAVTPTDPPEEKEPFLIFPLTDVTEFTARIGLSAGERGYSGITGRVAWGISWYINDRLIPVIEMRRGTTYTFRVNGGDDPSSDSEFHPLYLTSSIDGGYAQLSPQERAQEIVFEGIDITEQGADGSVTGFDPTAEGPICNYGATDATDIDNAESFEDFFQTLDRSCANDPDIAAGAGTLEFTPDENTPDLLYYQCVTHRSLGWEIQVIDADAPSIVQVDCETDLTNTEPIELGGSLEFRAVIDPQRETLTAELVYNGIGWVAMGFTNGAGVMVGSEAVLGLPDEPNSLTNPGKYTMTAQSNAGVQLRPDEEQTLINSTIVQTESQTILRFTKRLVEPGEHPIFAFSENTFLWAFGRDNDLAEHAARGSFSVTLGQCGVSVNGEIVNAEFVGASGVELADDNKGLWAAHGACAAIAWAILVPLAIGSAMVRRVFEAVGMPKAAWFQVHRGLNMIALLLTIAAFSIAVHLINQSGAQDHFSANRHQTIGLVIFLLTFLQALNGVFRPHLPHPVEVSEGDEETTEVKKSTFTPEKSNTRKGWEIGHRVIGAALVGMAWWQVQDGLTRFANRFQERDLTNIFWGFVGGICGCFAILIVYQRFKLKK